MPRHDSKGQRFLLQGPIEEVGEDSIVRDHDDDGAWELVDELEQILSGEQPALPSPSYYDEYDEAPFAPGEVVPESYNPYAEEESYADDEDEYYEPDEAGIEAVDYWVPAYRGPTQDQPRLTGPAPADKPPPTPIWPRRIAYYAGFGAIFVIAAAGAYFAFQMSDDQPVPEPAVAVAEPVAPEPEPAPVIVNVERIDPRVIEAPTVPAEAAADAAAPEPLVAFVDEPRVPALVAAPTPAAEAAAPAPAAATPVAETPVVAAPEPEPLEPVVTNGPVTEQGVTTAWVNLRTGPSNAYGVISVLAAGAEVGIVACDRWCEVEADGHRGWIHGDYITTAVTTPDAVVAEAGAEPVAPVVAAPFTANVSGPAGIYDSPFEDGAVAVTIRSGGEILIVGCDINWCETRFGDTDRRGWIDRRLVRMPDTITDAAIPPLPPITREQAAALKAAA
jgi:uncharacterized protein YraI